MTIIICPSGCCQLTTKEYKAKPKVGFSNEVKAGALIIDPVTKRTLIVQSRGKQWGIPKGGIEPGETIKECAIREVYEETGLVLINPQLTKKIGNLGKFNGNYYYVPLLECDVSMPDIPGNDSTGIGWISKKCMKDLINNQSIRVNGVTKKILLNTDT
jgi:hypothetical protein